ncbi:hypothetical protein DSCO28_70830 [Desulfosarcina ovata subsp. sediminis]|uniref:Uncharacterized protein n=1 Tax=Desulfosarcina ovata subsp. sediminis TaxID=885957 RepID=A0A5K8A1Z3_9BACT|nr:hypothetical protein [Desulfosarcina ovata]BBO86517.1 hypothetical protein DSCO28_70830 [Desulfosarcina ovata subsp. sediminis]
MKITKKTILAGMVAAVAVSAFSLYRFAHDSDPAPPVNQSPSPALPVTAPETRVLPSPNAASNTVARTQPPVMAAPPEPETVPDQDAGIDPVRLAQAELELVNNQIYEDVARDTLPTLSIQTHNPVWVLEQEAAGGGSTSGGGENQSGPLPAPEAGEFGMIQPPEGEIWLRISVDYASEHRDLMAQYADLYRTETAYNGTVTILLWVGGRPHDRQQYD